MYTLEIKEEANLEIIDAYSYYENQQSGLGETFFEQLGLYFKRITENPKHFEIKNNYREAYIKKFPYLIIYRIEEDNVVVYSVFSTAQNPKKKPN
ncbi:MAG TPA: plasmid stabilization system [Chryseobacterium sp.]|nr:plasmid stabilization system [Chryseobacterium sp.]